MNGEKVKTCPTLQVEEQDPLDSGWSTGIQSFLSRLDVLLITNVLLWKLFMFIDSSRLSICHLAWILRFILKCFFSFNSLSCFWDVVMKMELVVRFPVTNLMFTFYWRFSRTFLMPLSLALLWSTPWIVHWLMRSMSKNQLGHLYLESSGNAL